MPTINVVFEPETQTESPATSRDPYSALSLRVAEVVRAQLEQKPDSRIGLPTGRTPTGCYRILSQWSQDGAMDWSKAKCFGLDEYYDVDEAVSFRGYLRENIYQNINLPAQSQFSPLFADDYDGLIASQGGLSLSLLGIGKNGHIAFNEPGTLPDSWTHSVFLTESTREANAEFFKRKEQIPTRAVTMGIQTILASERILLIASGESKRQILEQALEGPVTTAVPASFLQLHNNVTVMTDFDI